MPLAPRQDPVGLYLHVPFCKRVCPFCSFVTRGFREERAAAFVEDLLAEIRLYAERDTLGARTIETIYLGGGTPTTLSAEQIAEILNACRASFEVARAAEITIEANPSGLEAHQLAALCRAGCTRLSLGVQSFDTSELESLGSPHTRAEIDRAVHLARRAGFAQLNLDLMYGLPGQSLERLQGNLRSAVALEPDHISYYALTIEEGTRFARAKEAGDLIVASDDLMAGMAEMGRVMLEEAGYVQYEVSNFARPGYECRHNVGYWTDREWLGLGPSAHSYLDGARFSNTDSLDTYHGCLFRRTLPLAECEPADHDLRLREAMAFGLRRIKGVHLGCLEHRYGIAPKERFRMPIALGVSAGWLQFDGDCLRLTRTGLACADELAVAFI